MSPLLLSMRPQQWVKNLFVFMPLIFGQKFLSHPETLHTLAAFVFFSLMASATYLLNDLFDRDRDRSHPVKRTRPVAQGLLTPAAALGACAVLFGLSAAGAFRLDPRLGSILLGYFALNVLYTVFLKKVVILDVFCLSFFFALRIAAGTMTAGVVFSHWMIVMVMLLALFLGFMKRRQEIWFLEDNGRPKTAANSYSAYFIDQMISVLTSSIVVVYMLYTIDERTVQAFGSRDLLFSAPFVYYGIFRYLYVIHEKHKGHDPTAVLFEDRVMQVNLLLWIGTCLAVIYAR